MSQQETNFLFVSQQFLSQLQQEDFKMVFTYRDVVCPFVLTPFICFHKKMLSQLPKNQGPHKSYNCWVVMSLVLVLARCGGVMTRPLTATQLRFPIMPPNITVETVIGHWSRSINLQKIKVAPA